MKKGEKIGVGEIIIIIKNGERNEPRGSLWRGRVEEPGDMPLMPPIRPPDINLSLKCQHVKFSSRMSE